MRPVGCCFHADRREGGGTSAFDGFRCMFSRRHGQSHQWRVGIVREYAAGQVKDAAERDTMKNGEGKRAVEC